MQTMFKPEQLKDPAIERSNQILRNCVHCGFCTATCPTYQILGDELDSPRGRIYLIKDMLENNKPGNEKIAKQKQGKGNNPTKQYKTPETKYLTSKEAPNGKAGNYAVYLPYNPGDPIKYVAIGGGSGEPTTTTPTLPDNNVNNEKMKLAEDFIKSKYKNLKPGSKEFTDKLMEKYNSL